MSPSVSVIMSVYDEPLSWIEVSVNSILNQTLKEIELVVIIDKPDREDIFSFFNNLQLVDKRIKFSSNEKNLGLIESLNRALAMASGEFIARMDADDCSRSDRLEKQLSYLKINGLDLVGCNVNLFNDCSGVYFTTRKLRTHRCIKMLMWCGTIGIVHPTFFARRQVYDDVGGYSRAPHVEDKEFIANVLTKGFRVGNHPEPLLDCRYSDDSVTKENAVYVHKMGRYVTRVYRRSLFTKEYSFNERYYDSLNVTKNELIKYREGRRLLSKSREFFFTKNYARAFFSLLKAFFLSPTVSHSVKVNLCIKALRVIDFSSKNYK